MLAKRVIPIATAAEDIRQPQCTDHDEDCVEVPDKVNCWLYAPEQGRCPYLEDACSRNA